eukprot:700122-Heterocapsa_arctica.AAC.1
MDPDRFGMASSRFGMGILNIGMEFRNGSLKLRNGVSEWSLIPPQGSRAAVSSASYRYAARAFSRR